MKSLLLLGALVLAFTACEQHTMKDLAILEHEEEHGVGHGETARHADRHQENGDKVHEQEAPKFFPGKAKAH
jgi:hypothetical protein